MKEVTTLLDDIDNILGYSDINYFYRPVFDIPTGRTLDYENIDDFDIFYIAKHIEKELTEIYNIEIKIQNKSNRHWNKKRKGR